MIKFRPHHFMCTLAFQGKGYSFEFIENYQKIYDTLNSESGNQIEIEIVNQTDSICQACPDARGSLCRSQEKVSSLDERHAKTLNLKPDSKITWGEAKKRISNHVTEEKFQEICEGCSWKELGICLSALKDLKKMFQ